MDRGRIAYGLAVSSAFVVIGCASRPALPPPGYLDVQVRCTGGTSGIARADLSWKRSRSRERLEVSVYKDGFKRDWLSSLDPIAAGTRFQATTRYRTEFPKSPNYLALTATAVTRDEAGRTLVRVEGFAPGLFYFWRVSTLRRGVWQPGEVMRSMAPACARGEKQ